MISNKNNEEKNIKKEQVLQKNKIEKNDSHIENISKENNSIDPKDERISELEITLMQLQQRERDNILRAKAEIENMRKRSEHNIEKAHKFALEHFIKELLPVIDNLERALDMLDKNNEELISTIKGVELTLKSLLDVMKKFGLSVIKEINVSFNPELHQAMAISESNEVLPNQVIKIMQKGYTLNGRLIRPAMVTVSKMKK